MNLVTKQKLHHRYRKQTFGYGVGGKEEEKGMTEDEMAGWHH